MVRRTGRLAGKALLAAALGLLFVLLSPAGGGATYYEYRANFHSAIYDSRGEACATGGYQHDRLYPPSYPVDVNRNDMGCNTPANEVIAFRIRATTTDPSGPYGIVVGTMEVRREVMQAAPGSSCWLHFVEGSLWRPCIGGIAVKSWLVHAWKA